METVKITKVRRKMVTQKLKHSIPMGNTRTKDQVQKAHDVLNNCLGNLSALQQWTVNESTSKDNEDSMSIKKELMHMTIDLVRALDMNDILRRRIREVQDKDIFEIETPLVIKE